MITGNANFNTALAKSQRQPCYIVRFEDNVAVQFSTGAVQNATYGTTLEYLNIPDSISQKVDFKKSVTTVSGFTFKLLDVSQYLTDFFYDLNTAAAAAPETKTPALNHEITLLVGFADIDEANFLEVVGYVDKMQYSGVSWEVTCRDLQRLTKQKVFKSARTTLTEDLDNSETGVDVADTSDFSSGGGGPTAIGDWFKIDDEIFYISAKSATTLTCTRGQLSTTAATHSNGAEVTQVFHLSGHPLDILSTDLWQTELGIAAGDIYTTAITDIKNHWLPNWEFEFTICEPDGVDAKKWAEEQIFTPTGTFGIIRGDGTLSVGIIKVPFPDEDSQTITEDTMAGASVGRVDRDMINEIEVYWDYNHLTNGYESKALFLMSDSINQFGKTNSLTWKLRGVHTAYAASSIITRATNRMFRLLGYSNPPIKTTVSMKLLKWEIGDVVDFTHPNLPDLIDGTKGIASRLMVVEQVKPNYRSGNVEMTFRDSSLETVASVAKIGEQTHDYGSATDDEKKYFYIGYNNIAPG